MASRWALCITVAVVAAVCVGGVDSFSLPEKVATLSSPNPVRGARTELDNWLVSLRVLRHLSPNSPHLADVDVNDVKSVTAAIAAEEKRLYEGSYPDVRAVVDALFEVQPDLYFVQVGAHAEDPANDLVLPRAKQYYEQHGHVVSGVVVDPFQDALNLVAEPVKELLAVPNPDTAGDPLRSHSDTAGIMLAPVAVCSHNSVGVMHGTLASDGSWIPNELPWKRVEDSTTRKVNCRTLPSLRMQYHLEHIDILQIACDGYEMEPLTGFSTLRPHFVWYRYMKLNPSHARFLERKLEDSGYFVSYHPDGYAWGWLVNPGGVNSVTRTKFTAGLIPGVERVEAPLPQIGRLDQGPVLTVLPPLNRRYVMHGEFQRNFCYYVVFKRPSHVTSLAVTFGKSFAFADKIVVEAAYDERDPGARGFTTLAHTRVYPLKSTHHTSSVQFRQLGELSPSNGSIDHGGRVVNDGGAERVLRLDDSFKDLTEATLFTRLRLRCDASIKETVGSLAIDALTVEFAPHGGHGDEL